MLGHTSAAILVMPGASSVSEQNFVRADIQLLHNSIDPRTNETSYLIDAYDGSLQAYGRDLHVFSVHVFQNTTVSIRIPQSIGILTADLPNCCEGCLQDTCCFQTLRSGPGCSLHMERAAAAGLVQPKREAGCASQRKRAER